MKNNVSVLAWVSPRVDIGAKILLQIVNVGGDPTKHK